MVRHTSRKDATLHEVLTTIRAVGPQTPEFRHPLARYSFRAVYADSGNRGQFATKDLGTVYSRDILGDPGTIDSVAPRLTRDDDSGVTSDRQKDVRTLDELRFVPGDYLCVAVLLPKSAGAPPPELSIKGGAAANGWKASGPLGPPRGPGAGAGPPAGRGGGGHWRGGSDAPSAAMGRGRGGRAGDFGRDRDRDFRNDRDRRPPPRRDSPPPRRDSPPPYRSRARSFSRSRSPPRRRR
jgi:histone deacetylase complex subunit SAP18